MPQGTSFAVLFALSALARGTMITVLPLLAHRALGDAQLVSELYFVVSLVSLTSTLAIPWVTRRLGKRWVLTGGALLMLAAYLVIATETMPWVMLGMMMQLCGVLGVELTLNVYILEHVARRDFVRFEPLRVFLSAGPWTVGPWLGVWLGLHVAPWAPFAFSVAVMAVLLAAFWSLGVARRPDPPLARPAPVNPLRFIPRFVRQPRLRLAWMIAFGRASWWYMFFIYAPIYVVTSGLGDEMAGAIVSIGSGMVFVAPAWGWATRRWGLRRILMIGFVAGGLLTLGVAAFGSSPWLGVAFFMAACVGLSAIDGVGNMPFFRAVRPLERAEMTAVFGMYRDTAQLLPPGLFALMLKALPLASVFVVSGLGMLGLAWLARYIPRRM